MNHVIENRLLDAWERHGEFGPAFVEVYEQVTGTVDALAEFLRPPYTADAVLGHAKVVVNCVGEGRYAVRANAIADMRRAGLSLHAVAAVCNMPVRDVVLAAHNVSHAKRSIEAFLLLDEMLVKGIFTNKEVVEATGFLPQTINRLCHLINRPTANNQPRVTTPEALEEVRRLHFILGMNKGLAIKQAAIEHPSLTRACGYAALRSPNGITERCAS